MPNNKHLQTMFVAEGQLDGAGHQLTMAIDALLMKVNDGLPLTDDDYARITLHAAVTRSLLDRVARALLKARAAPRLEWNLDEADSAAHPELILKEWDEEWKEEDWNKE